MWKVTINGISGTQTHTRDGFFGFYEAGLKVLYLLFLFVLSVATSGSLCPVGASYSAPSFFFPFLYALWVQPSPQQLRSGQDWHKKWSVIFNCHYGQWHGAKATIRESDVWLPFSNSYWHTPLFVSIFSSLLLLTLISWFMFLHSPCTLKIFRKDLTMPCTVKGTIFF